MLFAAGPISGFVEHHPTIKILALSFLVLIVTNLIAEGFAVYIPKGYTYFAMGFALPVEMLNLRVRIDRGRRRISDAVQMLNSDDVRRHGARG